MKILPTSFPIERNWQDYITLRISGTAVTQHNISLVFLQRFAAYVRDVFFPATGKKVTISSAYRSIESQAALYKKYLDGNGNLAAPPGTSWHNFGLAADITRDSITGPLRDNHNIIKNSSSRISQQPMYSSHGIAFTIPTEDWHIQPIETIGIPRDKRAFLLDADDQYLTQTGRRNIELTNSTTKDENGKRLYVGGNDINFVQQVLKVNKNGWYDENTSNAVRDFQRQNNTIKVSSTDGIDLSVNGKLDQPTWNMLFNQGFIPSTFVGSTSGGATNSITPRESYTETQVYREDGNSGAPVDYFDEEIEQKEWKVYYTGENGIKASLYLEKVKGLEIQEKRMEEVVLSTAKAEFFHQEDLIEDTPEFIEHIDKWETILNSAKPNVGISEPDKLLLPNEDSPYPPLDISTGRGTYINSVISYLNTSGNDMTKNPSYSSIYKIPLLKNRFSVTFLDDADPYAGYARKDVLLYLYLISIEMEEIIKKNQGTYNKLSVSLGRKNEIELPSDAQALEHYVGLAADIYLPRTGESAIIKTEDIANIIFSMGIKSIGLAEDYVHYDLTGSIETIWTIDGASPYRPDIIDLSKTQNMEIPESFL